MKKGSYYTHFKNRTMYGGRKIKSYKIIDEKNHSSVGEFFNNKNEWFFEVNGKYAARQAWAVELSVFIGDVARELMENDIV